MIPVTTSRGTFKVLTKRVGNTPRIKVLFCTAARIDARVLRGLDSFLPAAGSSTTTKTSWCPTTAISPTRPSFGRFRAQSRK